MKYRKGLFEDGYNLVCAADVQPGMIVALSRNRYFYVDDSCLEFKRGYAKLYWSKDISTPVLSEHTKVTFYDENENEITDIPGEIGIIAFERINGKVEPSKADVLKSLSDSSLEIQKGVAYGLGFMQGKYNLPLSEDEVLRIVKGYMLNRYKNLEQS